MEDSLTEKKPDCWGWISQCAETLDQLDAVERDRALIIDAFDELHEKHNELREAFREMMSMYLHELKENRNLRRALESFASAQWGISIDKN